MSEMQSKGKASQRADEFVTNFGKARALILKRIENLTTAEQAGDLSSKLTVLSNDIQEMSTSLHDATLFLPAFSIKMRQEEIRELEKALKERESLLIPKKKFGFKSKLQSPMPEATKPSIELVASPTSAVAASLSASSNFLTVENISNQTVTLEDDKLNKNDVLLRNIESSTFFLNGSPSTLKLVKLSGCKLICGPVFTSVFVEDCRDCVLFLCCQQLRVHSSEGLDIYLRVRSRAIIEDCSKIRFAPYSWSHPKSTELHQLTEITESLERYDCVDDFNWLSSSTPSPNWSKIPEAERVLSVTSAN